MSLANCGNAGERHWLALDALLTRTLTPADVSRVRTVFGRSFDQLGDAEAMMLVVAVTEPPPLDESAHIDRDLEAWGRRAEIRQMLSELDAVKGALKAALEAAWAGRNGAGSRHCTDSHAARDACPHSSYELSDMRAHGLFDTP